MNSREEELDRKIKEQNKKIVHYIFTISVSVLTSIFVCYMLSNK